MSCDNQNLILHSDTDKAITGVDGSIYYLAMDQLYPAKTPYLDETFSFQTSAQGEVPEKLQPPKLPQLPTIEEKNAELTMKYQQDNKTHAQKEATVSNIHKLDSDGKCKPCPPPSCPDIDYEWMQNNFFLIIALLIAIIIYLINKE